MSCKCAVFNPDSIVMNCIITGSPCMFLRPNSKACAEIYGEGPDAENVEKAKEGIKMKRKFVREKIDASTIQIGQKVKYSLFSNITFEGFDNNDQVILKDKYNNIKKVYRDLFEENAQIVNA